MVSMEEKYPFSLKTVLEQNEYENILDSNMFSAYIPEDLPIPPINDPRKTQASPEGIPRHPQYVRSGQINQIFSALGSIVKHQMRISLSIHYQRTAVH